MADEAPQRFSEDLANNRKKASWHSTIGLAAGSGLGAILASSNKLKGWSFAAKVMDIGFLGWAFGLISGMWSESGANQNSALKLDSKMIGLEHENAALKQTVTQLGGHVVETHENHVEKVKAAKEECCGCHLKR